MSRATQASASGDASTDGRRLRSVQSRQRIADALFELIGEGDVSPSARSVAERAGLGIRTVFRLFSDMDALYATVNERIHRELAPLLGDPPPADAPLAERVDGMVAERAALFERVAPYLRATQRKVHRSEFLASQQRALVQQTRKRLLAWFPELRDAPSDALEALDLVTSSEAWDRLRSAQRLSRSRAEATLRRAARALLATLDSPNARERIRS
ncbi:MAG: TetR/AcrR family transcriptional regulator [Myxococcota bacterium]